MNTPVIAGLVILVAITLGAKKRLNPPPHVWSKIWSMVFCLIAVSGLGSSLIGYRAASAHLAALGISDPDVAVSIPSLMMRISLAELLIGIACLVGSRFFYLRSQRQKLEIHPDGMGITSRGLRLADAEYCGPHSYEARSAKL